ATTALPPAQREWTCGLCDAGLPTLGRAQGRLSRRSHWQKCHDDVSFEGFCRKVVTKRNLAVQQERFPEHALVALPYRGHAEHVEYRKDGTRVTMTQFRCKRCLFAVAGASVASKQLRHGLSCEQNRHYTLTDSNARSQLREWWLEKRKGRPWATTWTVNAGLGETSWQALEAASQAEIDVVFLQEVGLTDQDCAAFEARARKFGYRSYFSGGAVAQSTAPHQAGRPTGGVCTLVSKALISRQLDHLVGEDAQAVAVRVEDLITVNLYQPPGKARDEAMSFVLGLLETLSRKHTWCIAGDFNDEPGENLLWDLLREEGACLRTGRRCIDYYIASHPTCFDQPALEDISFKDHRVVAAELQVVRGDRGAREPDCILGRSANLGCLGHVEPERWCQLQREVYATMAPPSLPAVEEPRDMDAMQKQVDDVWKQTSLYLEHFFRSTMRRAMEEAGEEAESIRGWSIRKNTQTFRYQEHRFGECDDPHTSARIQQLDNLRGRMRHMQWLRRKGREESAEGRMLEERIREGLTKHRLVTLKEVEAKLAEHRKQRRQGRIDRWRNRLRGSLRACCAWVEGGKARQVMLPKEGKGRRKKDGSIAVQALRPITILSCWWRLLGSVLLRSPDAQAWQKKWWREEAVGGRKAGEVYMPLMRLIDSYHQGEFIAFYDYTLAFDQTDPKLAVAVLRKLGCPRTVAAILEQVWTGQLRYMQYQGVTLRRPEEVGTSLPQGDPWSMIAMVAVLHLPITAIVARFPGTELSCFVDDRSWKSSTAQELLAVGEEWRKWSLVLGLKESEAKSQHAHWTAAGRKQLLRAGAPDTTVTDAPEILGVGFCKGTGRQGGRGRKYTRKEETRLRRAKVMLEKSARLPVCRRMKEATMASKALAVAEYGWIDRQMNKRDETRLQAAIVRARQEPKAGSPHLRAIFHGHRLSVRCRLLTTAFMAAWRTLRKDQRRATLGTWRRQEGCSGRIHAPLQGCGWQERAEWEWRHPVTGVILSLRKGSEHWSESKGRLEHVLREGWRANLFGRWRGQSRIDSSLCRFEQYDERRCKAARLLAEGSTHAASVMSGAFVSPAHLQAPDFEHVVWRCEAEIRPVGRPQDALQRRLLWPTGLKRRKEVDAGLLWRAVAIRKKILEERRGRRLAESAGSAPPGS
ncbi:unnamed protein product, partial [Prorocentrum cordatum]